MLHLSLIKQRFLELTVFRSMRQPVFSPSGVASFVGRFSFEN
jgi:hypothetical protein